MNNFRNLEFQKKRLLAGLSRLNNETQEQIMSAFNLAEAAHIKQKREEGDKYIIHPIRIANKLIYDLEVYDSEIIAAALLHDVVEDTHISWDEIQKKFGTRIAELVKSLTRDKDKETKKEKFIKTLNGPDKVKLIKSCDWLDNLHSLKFLSNKNEKKQRLIIEAKEMYLPMIESTKNQRLIKEAEALYKELIC